MPVRLPRCSPPPACARPACGTRQTLRPCSCGWTSTWMPTAPTKCLRWVAHNLPAPSVSSALADSAVTPGLLLGHQIQEEFAFGISAELTRLRTAEKASHLVPGAHAAACHAWSVGHQTHSMHVCLRAGQCCRERAHQDSCSGCQPAGVWQRSEPTRAFPGGQQVPGVQLCMHAQVTELDAKYRVSEQASSVIKVRSTAHGEITRNTRNARRLGQPYDASIVALLQAAREASRAAGTRMATSLGAAQARAMENERVRTCSCISLAPCWHLPLKKRGF